MTYPRALVFALLTGLGIYAGIAAGPNATSSSAVSYGLGAAGFIALAACAAVAYRNGQPDKR